MYSRGNGVTTSVLFPGRRIQITNIKYSQDPLVRQQVRHILNFLLVKKRNAQG